MKILGGHGEETLRADRDLIWHGFDGKIIYHSNAVNAIRYNKDKVLWAENIEKTKSNNPRR